MDISFIVPAYNEAGVIAGCLASLLAETARHPDITAEIIVVNNASTDGTAQAASAFAPRVRIITEPRKGLVYARAAGGEAASGLLLAHIDADCQVPQGWLDEVLRQFRADPQLVALSGPYQYRDLPAWQRGEVAVFYRLAYAIYWLNNRVLRLGSMLQGGNFVVKKWAWDRLGPADSRFEFYGEDTELCRRLFRLGGVRFDLNLPVASSGRRLAKEGILTMGARYALNYFSVLLLKRPATKTHLDIRNS
ncbi:MAG TPA: glycosyltransferase family A protein [Patescibacteria group bacterium]|nr:glycosyltransferase family A protein [Patescibacteria group bacterium]